MTRVLAGLLGLSILANLWIYNERPSRPVEYKITAQCEPAAKFKQRPRTRLV